MRPAALWSGLPFGFGVWSSRAIVCSQTIPSYCRALLPGRDHLHKNYLESSSPRRRPHVVSETPTSMSAGLHDRPISRRSWLPNSHTLSWVPVSVVLVGTPRLAHSTPLTYRSLVVPALYQQRILKQMPDIFLMQQLSISISHASPAVYSRRDNTSTISKRKQMSMVQPRCYTYVYK